MTKPAMLSICKRIKDMNEKMNIDIKNLGKIVLKTGLAFSGFNSLNMTGVFKPT